MAARGAARHLASMSGAARLTIRMAAWGRRLARVAVTLTALLLAALGPVALPAGAQPLPLLRGAVRDSASGAAVPGAVVLALGARGDTVARTVTREDGRFAVPLARPAARVQALRLGYRPQGTALPRGTDGPLPEITLTLVRLPTLLGRVQVNAARCRARPDREEAAALLEEARTGLLAMQVAHETSPAAVVRLAYTREYAADGRTIVRQQVRVDSGEASTASFGATRSGADFVRLGFRTREQGDQLLFGPDARVLLDPGFAAGYCFHRAPDDAARPTEVGVAFEPARRERDRVDIEGALWIDTLARAVTGITFRYAGVEEAAQRAGAGGAVRLRAMPSGVVLIDQWWLRTLAPPSRRSADGGDAGRATPVITEVGGALAHAAWQDGARWEAPLGTVRLTVRTAAGLRAAGVTVGLRDTDYRADTDVDGLVELPHVLPGPYAVVVRDSVLAPLGVALPTALAPVVDPGDTVRLTLDLPTAEGFLRPACPGGARGTGAMVVARVVDPTGMGLAGVAWRLRRSRGGDWVVVAERGTTDADGRLLLCDAVAVGDVMELQLVRGRTAPETVVFPVGGAITAVPVILHDGGPVMAEGEAAGTLLTGVVRDPDSGAPIAEARVSLAGTLLESVTDSSGAFLLGGIPRGDYQVEVRTPWLDSIGTVHRAAVRVSGAQRRLEVTLPPAGALLAAACGARREGGLLVGRVRVPPRGEGAAAWSVRLTVSWHDRALQLLPDGTAVPRLRWVEARTDSAGTYRVCGVPVELPVTVTVAVEEDRVAAVLAPGGAPQQVRLPLARRAARVDVTLDSAVVGAASFTGRLVDAEGAPVAYAEVRLPGLSRATLTSEAGRFRLEGVPPGTHQVTVTREGFAPLTAQVPFAANRVVDHRLVLTPTP